MLETNHDYDNKQCSYAIINFEVRPPQMPPAAAGPLLSQTPPSPLAAAARCQRRRHHCSLLALATDADAVTDH